MQVLRRLRGGGLSLPSTHANSAYDSTCCRDIVSDESNERVRVGFSFSRLCSALCLFCQVEFKKNSNENGTQQSVYVYQGSQPLFITSESETHPVLRVWMTQRSPNRNTVLSRMTQSVNRDHNVAWYRQNLMNSSVARVPRIHITEISWKSIK